MQEFAIRSRRGRVEVDVARLGDSFVPTHPAGENDRILRTVSVEPAAGAAR